MKRLLAVLLAVFALGTASGCGSDRDKGAYKDQDRPRSDEKDR